MNAPRSPLFGRRVHIAGSISNKAEIASGQDVEMARAFVQLLVPELMRQGATFVVPVDAQPCRDCDGHPICFDWLVWEAIYRNLAVRPTGAPNPLVVAVQHHKNEEQVPPEWASMWDDLRGSDLVLIDNASHWNMASKRMEVQARHGDILLCLGGSEGILFLANLYHDAGKHVVPLNFKLCEPRTGALRLFEFGLSSENTSRLFRTEGAPPHAWLNRINFTFRNSTTDRASKVVDLFNALSPPSAFCVRLLNHAVTEHFSDVENYFESVVKPVVEEEFRYKLLVVDGVQSNELARIDQEIFVKLHRSQVVIVDITGVRPNCMIELGYALGRPLPTMVLGKKDTEHPFDIGSLPGLHWESGGKVIDKKAAFRAYWKANINRPSLVPVEPLIP